MMKISLIAATAALVSLAGGGTAMAEDFPATPMNSGPMMMMPMQQPMAAPMAAPAEQPMMRKPMTMRQKRMMMKQKMMMHDQQPMQ